MYNNQFQNQYQNQGQNQGNGQQFNNNGADNYVSIQVIGRIVEDPTSKMHNESKVATTKIAVNHRGQNGKTDYWFIEAWANNNNDTLHNFLVNNCPQGRKVFIEGTPMLKQTETGVGPDGKKQYTYWPTIRIKNIVGLEYPKGNGNGNNNQNNAGNYQMPNGQFQQNNQVPNMQAQQQNGQQQGFPGGGFQQPQQNNNQAQPQGFPPNVPGGGYGAPVMAGAPGSPAPVGGPGNAPASNPGFPPVQQ